MHDEERVWSAPGQAQPQHRGRALGRPPGPGPGSHLRGEAQDRDQGGREADHADS